MPHVTRSFGFHSRIIRRYGYIHLSCGRTSRHGKTERSSTNIICNDKGNIFIATLHNVRLAPDLCKRLFLIITLMNSGHNFIFHKGFCTIYFGAKDNNAVTLPHNAQRKHAFIGKIMEKSKKKITSKKENCFTITTSKIRTQIHQIIVSWGYC